MSEDSAFIFITGVYFVCWVKIPFDTNPMPFAYELALLITWEKSVAGTSAFSFESLRRGRIVTQPFNKVNSKLDKNEIKFWICIGPPTPTVPAISIAE